MRLGRADLGLGGVDVAVGRLLGRLGARGCGLRQMQLAAAGHGGHRNLRARAGRGRLGCRQIRFGALHRDPIVAGIDFDQHLAGLHGLVVAHVHGRHRSHHA